MSSKYRPKDSKCGGLFVAWQRCESFSLSVEAVNLRFPLISAENNKAMSAYLTTLNHQIQKGVKSWVNRITESPEQRSGLKALQVGAALRLVTRFVGQAIPFATRNGFEVIDFRPGYVKARIPLKPNKNHFNAMYAGALFTVAELPGGIISIFSFDDRFYPVLKDLKMDFIRMAKTDVTVEFELRPEEISRIEKTCEKEGKCHFVLQGQVKDADAVVVATSFANYQVRQK